MEKEQREEHGHNNITGLHDWVEKECQICRTGHRNLKKKDLQIVTRFQNYVSKHKIVMSLNTAFPIYIMPSNTSKYVEISPCKCHDQKRLRAPSQKTRHETGMVRSSLHGTGNTSRYHCL